MDETSGAGRVLRIAVVVVVAVSAVLASRELLEASDPTSGQLVVTDATPAPSATRQAVARATPPWSELPPAPVRGREAHTLVWTGRTAIVWGGRGEERNPPADSLGRRGAAAAVDAPLRDGAAYDPADGSWTRVPPAPVGRADHTAVWTGEEMLVWGGEQQRTEGASLLRSGEAFDPRTGTWRELAQGPLSGRSLHTAVWTGREMVVWGGTLDGDTTDGAAYDPATDTWRELAPAPLPARAAHTAVWTGREMVVWGGIGIDGVPSADGAAYDPAADTWRPVATATLDGRTQNGIVWDGERVLVWGGAGAAGAGSAYADGAAWDPQADAWTPLPPAPIEGRFAPVAVWTGRRMVVWGGIDAQLFTDGATYHPGQGTWRLLPNAPVDSPSRYPGVWTGRQMIVWAGRHDPSAAALDLPGG